MSSENIKSIAQEKYGAAAKRAGSGQRSACCGTSPASSIEGCDPITSNLYAEGETSVVPETTLRASRGCGNPTALAKLQPGETVLDLGSGGGIDVLLSARRVGPTGKAYGLDMTDEMLALAEENKRKSGLTNVEFLKGEIENIPLPDNSVDVIVSNCVINLSGDKDRAPRSVPGTQAGRSVRDFGCRRAWRSTSRNPQKHGAMGRLRARALSDVEYSEELLAAGFENVDVEETRVYNIDDASEFLEAAGIDAASVARKVQDRFISAFVRASKPASAKACREPTCCAD